MCNVHGMVWWLYGSMVCATSIHMGMSMVWYGGSMVWWLYGSMGTSWWLNGSMGTSILIAYHLKLAILQSH